MPTYEYKCDACGHAFEAFQSIKAAPTKKCPECGKLKVRRLIGTGVGLIFKGSGFYITDYRSEGYKNAAKSDTGGGTKDSGGGESKGGDSKPTEAKPAAKAEASSKKSDAKSSKSK